VDDVVAWAWAFVEIPSWTTPTFAARRTPIDMKVARRLEIACMVAPLCCATRDLAFSDDA
jgi:hypothetical protein